MIRYFDILDGDWRGMIMLDGDAGWHRITVDHSSVSAWRDLGGDEDRQAQIVYPPTRSGWTLAFRWARQIARATPGNQAVLTGGGCGVRVLIGQHLGSHVHGAIHFHSAPLMLPTGEEVWQ